MLMDIITRAKRKTEETKSFFFLRPLPLLLLCRQQKFFVSGLLAKEVLLNSRAREQQRSDHSKQIFTSLGKLLAKAAILFAK